MVYDLIVLQVFSAEKLHTLVSRNNGAVILLWGIESNWDRRVTGYR